jgi:hypothetical protein
VCRDELAKITNVLDEKVPTFFLQPAYYNGERRKPFAFFISPQQQQYKDTLPHAVPSLVECSSIEEIQSAMSRTMCVVLGAGGRIGQKRPEERLPALGRRMLVQAFYLTPQHARLS